MEYGEAEIIQITPWLSGSGVKGSPYALSSTRGPVTPELIQEAIAELQYRIDLLVAVQPVTAQGGRRGQEERREESRR